jgi:type III restriction enzyme
VKYFLFFIIFFPKLVWCADINKAQDDVEYDFVFVDQESFDKYQPKTFDALMESFTEYKS